MMRQSGKALAQSFDPGCRSEKRPHDWGNGRMGTRFVILDSAGAVLATQPQGETATSNSWFRAAYILRKRAGKS